MHSTHVRAILTSTKMAIHPRRHSFLRLISSRVALSTRLSRRSFLVIDIRSRTSSRTARERRIKRRCTVVELGNRKGNSTRRPTLGALHHLLRHLSAVQLAFPLYSDDYCRVGLREPPGAANDSTTLRRGIRCFDSHSLVIGLLQRPRVALSCPGDYWRNRLPGIGPASS